MLRTAALFLGLVGGVWGGVALAGLATTKTSAFSRVVLEGDMLYRFGMQALVLEISNSDFLAGLNLGPIHVSRQDVGRIMHSTFDVDDTSAKARKVHRSLAEFMRRYEQGMIFRVEIAEERPILLDSLRRVVQVQYSSLPDCDVSTDLSTILSATGLKLFGGSEREFFNENHPEDCRPPEIVASRVEEGISEEFRRMSETGPDSLEAFPDDGQHGDFARLLARVQTGLTSAHWAWPLLLVGLAVGLYAPRKDGAAGPARWHPILATGLGLIFYGIVAIGFAPGRIQATFGGIGTEGEASGAWANLGGYIFRRVAVVSGLAAILLSLALVAVALLIENATGDAPDPDPNR